MDEVTLRMVATDDIDELGIRPDATDLRRVAQRIELSGESAAAQRRRMFSL
jgi:hypothetical protein